MALETDAREHIDRLLMAAGWLVSDAAPGQWESGDLAAAEGPTGYIGEGGTFLSHLQHMPALNAGKLWPVQIKAIQNLEQSLKKNRPRALIQMATGSGKTFTAISFIYRLIKFAEEYVVQRTDAMLKGRDFLPDLHANNGSRLSSRSTNPMTSFYC